MKKLLLFAAVMMMSFAAFAQGAPDASQWKVGDDVSEAVGFGNLSFENNPMDCWTFKSSKGSTTTTGGLFECYEGADCDLYQCILLPAGMYELNCQGYYRFGTSWDVDPNSYANDTWENLSKLYAEAGTYDIDSEEFTSSGSTFSNPLMPRLFEGVMEMLFEDTDYKKDENGDPILDSNGNIQYNAGWNMSDGQYNQVGGCWGPCSVPGTKVWFDSNKYLPFESDEDETVYNKVTFFVTEATWVKLGVQKIEAKAADSFFATNFHLIYKGTADEAAKLALAYKSLEIAQKKAEALAEEIMLDYPALGALLLDEVMDLDYDDKTVEGIEAGTQAFNELFNAYTQFYQDAKALTAAIASMEEMVAATDYEGKDAFVGAIEAAKAIAEAEEVTNIDGPDAYANAYNALNEAKGAYVLTRPAVDGVYNYSDFINHPFFCNNEYTPTWDEEEGCFKYSDEIESTFMTIREQSVKDILSEHADWTNIASNVTWTSKSGVTGEWIFNHNITSGWMGGIDNVTIQHGYTAVGAWSASPTGGYQEMRQTIIGLPDGYYSMGALFMNAGNEPSEYDQYVYICAGEQPNDETMAKAQFTHKSEHFWWGTENLHLWRTDDWQSLQTEMIKVEGGALTIGSRSNGFYAVTGFQLYYYGAEPDFTAMIQKKLDAVTAEMENLTFPGDYAYVDALLKTIPATIVGFDGYDTAKNTIAEASEYIATAYGYLNNWNLGDEIANAQGNYEAGDPEYQILDKMFDYFMTIGTNETDTYKTAQEASALYAKLNTYLTYRAKVAEYAVFYPVINDIIADQNTGLLAGVTPEKLDEYTKVLEAAESVGAAADLAKILAPLGLDKATPENPVDITLIVKNPTYNEGNTGWDGAITVDNRLHNAERYNTTFDVSQTIKSLPAGCYLVKVQAYYRDGGSAGDVTSGVYYNWNVAAEQNMDLWANKNVELYAKTGDAERISYVQSLASVQYTEPGTDKIFNKTDDSNVEQATDENGNLLYDENGNEIWTDPDTLWYTYDDAEISWTLDQRVNITDENGEVVATYYYPNSMEGANARFNKTPEAYQNEVAIMVEDGGNLTFGLRKSKEIGNDWCMFDNWKLFYLGPNAPEAIEEIAGNKEAVKAIYNIAGQRIQALQKGLNIVDGKKVYVK